MGSYFIVQNDSNRGPFEKDQLAEMLAKGQIEPTSQVFAEGDEANTVSVASLVKVAPVLGAKVELAATNDDFIELARKKQKRKNRLLFLAITILAAGVFALYWYLSNR